MHVLYNSLYMEIQSRQILEWKQAIDRQEWEKGRMENYYLMGMG